MDGFLKTNLKLISSVASERYNKLLEAFNEFFKDTPLRKKQLEDHLRRKNIYKSGKRFDHSEYDLSAVVENRRKKIRVSSISVS
jgi:hypothetical protein